MALKEFPTAAELHRWLSTLRNRLVLLFGVATAIALLAPSFANAEGTPNIALAANAPAQALIGTQQEVHLTASNPAEEPRGYNLTFRDVLPKGVAYSPAPPRPSLRG
ncbi:MAG TPA: hypothetical protein VGI17_13400 [Solirubrobacterales bacterium]|jgi:hypothetical protein